MSTNPIMSTRDPKKPVQANAQNRYLVTRADLPVHCPMDGMTLWDSHPRVYLPIETTGKAKCPYCGADYELVEAGEKR